MKALTTTELVQAVLKYNKPLNLVSPNPAQDAKHPRMRNSHRLVLVAIANRYNSNTGRCNPTRDTIASDCQATVRTVDRAIAEARGGRILSWIKLSFHGGRSNNSYCWQGLCPSAKPAWIGEVGKHTVTGVSTTGDKKDTAQQVATVLQEPVEFDLCADLLIAWGSKGAAEGVTADAVARYIKHRNLDQADAALFVKQAMHYEPLCFENNEEGVPPLAFKLSEAVAKKWRRPFAFDWLVDSKHDKQKVRFIPNLEQVVTN